MPRFETLRLQAAIFQIVITIASGPRFSIKSKHAENDVWCCIWETIQLRHLAAKTLLQLMHWCVMITVLYFQPPQYHSTPKWIWIKSSLPSKWPSKPQSKPPKGSKSLEIKILHGTLLQFPTEGVSKCSRKFRLNSLQFPMKSLTHWVFWAGVIKGFSFGEQKMSILWSNLQFTM